MNRKSKTKLGLFLLICLTSTVFSSFLLELPQNSPSSAILDNGGLQFTMKEEEFYITQFEKLTGIPFVAGEEDLPYSTYLNTVEQNSAFGIVVDSDGYAYITGRTSSENFRITAGANDTSYNGGVSDAFICKLNQYGTAVEYCTYIGGSESDTAYAIALDGTGNTYITGRTTSTDFPTTPGAIRSTINGGTDIFVCKLSADGSMLNYSTLIGGSDQDYATDIVVDSLTNVYITGYTYSDDFPTTFGAYDPSFNGVLDGFVCKLSVDGVLLNFSTFLGGNSVEYPQAITLDENEDVFICGHTLSYDFPKTLDALDSTRSGYDGFVTGISANGSSLIYSSLLGGSYNDYATDIEINATGYVFISGYTTSSNFPVTPDAYDGSFNGIETGLEDGFIYVFDKITPQEIYSSYLGGAGQDIIQTLKIGPNNELYLSGRTQSSTFPTTLGSYNTLFKNGFDLFICKFNANLTSLNYSTLVGSYADDQGYSCTVDSLGSLYLCGTTEGSLFPTTPGALSTGFNGQIDGIVLKINEDGSFLNYSTNLGFSGGVSYPHSIEVDSFGCVYIAGYTNAPNFRTTINAVDITYNGGYDIFICKLNADGTQILYSTFLGGNADDYLFDMAIDAEGCVYVSGHTQSPDFPTTPGAMNTTLNGVQDGFIAKLNPDGSSLIYSTHVGGSSIEYLYTIIINSEGQATVGGASSSANFPVTANAINITKNVYYDVVLFTLNAEGTHLIYSTFLGGEDNDFCLSITLGPEEHIYLTGRTESKNFPTTPNCFDNTLNGEYDTFIMKLSADYSSLEFSTLLGGSESDFPENIIVDDVGSAVVVGYTYSDDFNITLGALDSTYEGSYEGFISKLNADGSALEFSSYYGGDESDRPYDVVFDAFGNIIITGMTSSSLNTTSNAFDPTGFPGGNVFICRYAPDGSQITYNSYLGGLSSDYGYALTTDSDGYLYITGRTYSDDFPTSEGAMITADRIVDRGYTVFISKFDIRYSLIQMITANQTITTPYLNLEWDALGMTEYEIFINEKYYGSVSGNSTVLEFWENGEYLIYLKGYDADLELDISDPVALTVDLTPSPPTILTQENEIQTNFIGLSWSEITDASYYKVYVDEILVGTSVGTFETIVFPENGTYSITVSTVHYGYESVPSSPLILDVTIPSTVTTDTGDGDDSSRISGFSSSSLALLLFVSMGSLIAYVSKKKLVKLNMQ